MTDTTALKPGFVDRLDFQQRVYPWLLECFGPEISQDRLERNDRFIEEALELVQACGYSADRAHALVDYVFGRPAGEPSQEVGGVMVTLASLCLANGLDMHQAGEVELDRIMQPAIIEKIRAKQAAKPRGSSLPVPSAPDPAETLEQYADRVVATTRKKLLDRLDDDVIGCIRDSHLVFGKACAMEAISTALSEAGYPQRPAFETPVVSPEMAGRIIEAEKFITDRGVDLSGLVPGKLSGEHRGWRWSAAYGGYMAFRAGHAALDAADHPGIIAAIDEQEGEATCAENAQVGPDATIEENATVGPERASADASASLPHRRDDFSGDTAHLIRSIDALLDLDDAKALVPHGVGGKGAHAYRLLCAARHRLAAIAMEGR